MPETQNYCIFTPKHEDGNKPFSSVTIEEKVRQQLVTGEVALMPMIEEDQLVGFRLV